VLPWVIPRQSNPATRKRPGVWLRGVAGMSYLSAATQRRRNPAPSSGMQKSLLDRPRECTKHCLGVPLGDPVLAE
jgi:hypothetical protein